MTEAPIPAVALDHVGIAAPAADSPLLALLGTELGASADMPSGVRVARFGPAGRLELVSPAQPGNPVERFLERRGPGLHHIALCVDAPLSSVLGALAARGTRVVGPIEPASDGRLSAFIHPESTGGILVELVEDPTR